MNRPRTTPFEGVLLNIWVDDDGEEHTETVTATVNDSISSLAASALDKQKKIDSLGKDLQDIKSRRGWEEITLATDDRTGRMAVVRTYYRWQAESMRLDFDQSMMPQPGYLP